MEPKTPERTATRVILMSCGSYNPPTHMHLRMFERARDHLHNLGTHVVLGGVISPVNDAYAKKELACGIHRCEMLKLALLDSDWIRLSDWEVLQHVWTRTRASLEHHQSTLNAVVQGSISHANGDLEDYDWVPESLRNNDPNRQMPVQIKLLCGGDLLESFATPGLWADEDIIEIVGHYGLVVITREGSNPYKFIYDSDILSKHLIVTEWIPNEVSSTRIRRALKRGESVKYLLHDAVIDYVYTKGIYGAKKPSIIKLEISSNNSSIDYLDSDQTKHQHNNTFLTSLPDDINIQDTNTYNSRIKSIINELSESVIIKNGQNNSSPTFYDDQSSQSSIANTYNEHEKLLWSMVFDSINVGQESSSILLQSNDDVFHHIVGPIDLPSSARARNELLAFEDTTESELETLCHNTFSIQREEDILSITYEGSSKDLNEPFIKNYKDCSDNESSEKINIKNISAIQEESDILFCSEIDNDESDSETKKFETNLEIDGKYLKSLVNSKKSLKKTDDIDNTKFNKKESKEIKVEDKPKIDEKSIQDKIKAEAEKEIKLFDDISYIKRLRLIINNTSSEHNKNQRQQLQGSLDSINLNEASIQTNVESMSKKCKSFESIKRNTHISYKKNNIPYSEIDLKIKSDCISGELTSQFDYQTNNYCSACYLDTNNEHSHQSNCSSPEAEDSECDICSSYNLDNSNEVLDFKNTTITESISEITEICEICGEPATIEDEPTIDTRPMQLSLPKAKSTMEISRGSYKMSTLDDDHFEIDNCGLQDCKLRASLDTCNKPEPVYVNVIPKHRQFMSEIDNRQFSRLKSDQDLFFKSKDINCETDFISNLKYTEPTDEISSAKYVTIGGNKRLIRNGSYYKSNATDKTQEKRRYSSVDNLQNKIFYKSSGEKISKSRENKFMTSADSIRPSRRIIRSKSLRRSADNVGRFDTSGDNLDSLEENVNIDGNGVTMIDNSKCTKLNIRDNDTIKMILTKHGIKIISQKETVL